MITTRRSLLASLGLVLPAVAAATAAEAATLSRTRHPGKHVHNASAHMPHHAKAHRSAARRGHTRRA